MVIRFFAHKGDNTPIVTVDDEGAIHSTKTLQCDMSGHNVDVLLEQPPKREVLQCERDLARYNKILAIKSVRNRLGIPLLDAKNMIEDIALLGF